VLAGLGGFFRLLVEVGLDAERPLSLGGGEALRAAVGEEFRRLRVVLEEGFEDAGDPAAG